VLAGLRALLHWKGIKEKKAALVAFCREHRGGFSFNPLPRSGSCSIAVKSAKAFHSLRVDDLLGVGGET
jgi:hypothetical protein